MNARSGKLMVQVLFLLLLTELALSEANSRLPARILAKQTGAAQFEEHIEQPIRPDCNEHRHRLRKRSSDEDLDYEVYQGVVGRPGIDFPIFPRIPQTTFSCRSYGNGYFADLETSCQVFHICEEGRKISFLCPNGTIFQQSELTCDWWFKVNCAGSPGFYAESAEILNKARKQRVRPTAVYKGYTNNKVIELLPTGRPFKKSDRRIDSNENRSVESLDFEDISDDRANDRSNDRSTQKPTRTQSRNHVRSRNRSNDKLKIQKDIPLAGSTPQSPINQHNEHELQITAETSSFVKDPRQNSYTASDKTLNKGRESVSTKALDKTKDLQAPKSQSIVRNSHRNDFNQKQKTGKNIELENEAGPFITIRPEVSDEGLTGDLETPDEGTVTSIIRFIKENSEGSVKDSGKDNVKGSAKDSVKAGIEDSVKAKIEDSVIDSIEDGFKDSVTGPAKDSVTSRAKDSIRGSAKDSFKAIIKDSVIDSIEDGFKDSVAGPAKDSVKGRAKDSIRGSAKDSFKANIEDSVIDSIENRFKGSVTGPANDSIKGSAKDSIRGSAKDSFKANIEDSVIDSIENRFKGSVTGSVTGPAKDSIKGSAKDSIRGSAKDSFKANIEDSVIDSIEDRFKGSVTGSVTGPAKHSITGTAKDSIRGNAKDSVKDGIKVSVNGRSQISVKDNVEDGFAKQKAGKRIDGFFITVRPEDVGSTTVGRGNYYTTAQPESYKNRNSLDDIDVIDKQFVTPNNEDRKAQNFVYSTLKPDFFANGPIVKSATAPSVYPGTYSTARRIDSTRTTPFYTPTVPTVAKVRPTDSKSFYIKLDQPTTLRGAITSENTTPKPSNGESAPNSDVHRFPIYSNGELKVQLPVYTVENPKPAGLSLTTSTSGPTYLPKGTERDRSSSVTPANNANIMSQNVKGILDTVGVIKETMKTNFDNVGVRVGLDIPPSSGPGTLISLTNYFANDDGHEDTTVSSEEEGTTTTSTVDISASLLSNKTSGKYLSLFGLNQDDDQSDQHLTATTVAPKTVSAPTVVGDFTRTTIKDLAQNPETRKIAQVFSNAITKYIENPDTFRKDLIGVRPTAPPPSGNSISDLPNTTPSYFSNGGTVTVSILSDTTLADRILNKGVTQPYAVPTTTEKYEATTSAVTASNDIAKEINNQFEGSTSSYEAGSTEFTEATTYRGSSFSTSRPRSYPDAGLSSELLPPAQDDEGEHESLHKVQSQSFVKSYNDLSKSPKAIAFDKNKNSLETSSGKATTAGYSWPKNQKDNVGPTENPWLHSAQDSFDTTTDKALQTTTSQGDYEKTTKASWVQSSRTDSKNKPDLRLADQTTIAPQGTSSGKSTQNDGSTRKPWTQSSVTSTVDSSKSHDQDLSKIKPTENPWSQITHSIYLDPLTINDGLMHEPKGTTLKPFDFVNTDRSRFEDVSENEEDIDDILNSPELSSELLPKNNGLQRIANKIFGGLNETEAIHLKNVMKKAEHNQSVLRLLLLLIQTCDDQDGKALEKSRKILLNALIGMDSKLQSKRHPQPSVTTTNKIPVTTYRRNFNDSPTTVLIPTTTDVPASSEETTKFEIRVPDLDEEAENTSTSKSLSTEQQSASYDNPNRTSDQRALELLKSLYSLASKFSRR